MYFLLIPERLQPVQTLVILIPLLSLLTFRWRRLHVPWPQHVEKKKTPHIFGRNMLEVKIVKLVRMQERLFGVDAGVIFKAEARNGFKFDFWLQNSNFWGFSVAINAGSKWAPVTDIVVLMSLKRRHRTAIGGNVSSVILEECRDASPLKLPFFCSPMVWHTGLELSDRS